VAGDSLPDGSTADAVYVVLGSWYLENLNANYVAPLDFLYFQSLEGAITSRMYELLHHWFFVTLRMNQSSVTRRYSTLCAYFPLTRQDSLWKAKKQLRDAHQKHHQNAYLDCLPEWRPISGTKNDWTLVYTPGQKARDEYRRNHSRRDQEGLAPDELPAGAQQLLPLSLPFSAPDCRQDLVHELEIRGITQKIAHQLVQKNEPTLIQRKIEAFDWLMAKTERPLNQNPAGYLRASIEQDYAAPEGFVPREERQRKAAEDAARGQAEKQAAAAAAQQLEEEAARLDAVWSELSKSEQDTLRERAIAGLNDFARAALRREEAEGRKGAGHRTLHAEIQKLLAAELES